MFRLLSIAVSFALVTTVACKARVDSSLQNAAPSDLTPWVAKFAMELRQEDQGVFVAGFSEVELSPACAMGLEAGDRIVSLNGYAVASIADFQIAAESFLQNGSSDPDEDAAHWCFAVERRGKSLRLPFDCQWQMVASHPQLKFFIPLCQPRSMYQCGSSPDRCQRHLRR